MSLLDKELDEIVSAARRVAVQAGDLLLLGLNQPKRVEYKGAVDLVTQYDRQAEDFIRQQLKERFYEIDMLAEENQGESRKGVSARWIVDPLDGTTNFSHDHPVFAVSIGLEERGELKAGVVTIPTLGLTMWARQGGGAFCNDERIRVSGQKDLCKSLIATGFPYDRRTVRDDNTREFCAFIKKTQGVRRMGAAAVDLALVARGVFDGFFEPRLHPWDLAAGVVLVREAGGNVTDYNGAPIDIHKGWVVASNNRIHNEMLALIKQARKTL